MAKRFQPMKEFGRSMKKPKLDISICRGGNPAEGPSTSKAPYGRKVSPIKCSQSNFWDDDDDDVILLATQVAEAAVAADKGHSTTITKDQFVMSESELTFSEFGCVSTTSTQHQVNRMISTPNILSQMFDDDDDFDLLAVVEKADPGVFKKPHAPQPPIRASQAPNSHQQFEKPQDHGGTRNVPKPKNSVEPTLNVSMTYDAAAEISLVSAQSTARKQLASERQIKFLMDKVDDLKKENSKLSNDLEDTKSKMESKEGETSLLRDELRHMKQQAQNLKMEKLMNAEAAKNECQAKISELAKKVEAQEAEIRLKEAQTSRMRMRHADETQKLHQSMCMDSIMHVDVRQRTPREGRSKLDKCQMKMQCLDLNNGYELPATKSQAHPLIFETSQDRGSTKKQRTLFQLELENIQTLLAQLQLSKVQMLPPGFEDKCVQSVCKVLTEFWSYIHSLEYLKNCRIYPYHDYSLSSSKLDQSSRLLQQPSEIYDEERCISLRRYFAALSIICHRMPLLAKDLLQYKHGEYHLLQIVTDTVNKMGFAREICEHFGVLEALCVWLRSLLKHVSQKTALNELAMLMDLMKHIVFTRPSAWIFQEISLCLWECCRLPPMLDMLCINSPESTFAADRVRSIHRFSNDSCFLQVYCSLLEIAFPLNSRLSLDHLKLLTTICLSHVRFSYQCFVKPPKFIHKMLPNDDDEDEDSDVEGVGGNTTQVGDRFKSSTSVDTFDTTHQNSTSRSVNNVTKSSILKSKNDTKTNNEPENSKPRCECYIKLCLSVVSLLYQLMRQWIYTTDHYTAQVAEISRLAVQLLHLIFCDNYLTCLFRDSEATTKHYLCLITKWWSENSKKLQFDDLNLKFLQKILDSHVLPKEIALESNYNNVIADLSKWQISTKDDVSNIRVCNAEEAKQIADQLQLVEDASNKETFFESLKGFAFSFQ